MQDEAQEQGQEHMQGQVRVRERWLEWNGMRYRVWERPVPGSTMPPLVLVHGYAACLEQWGRFIRDIGAEVPVYAVDLIGYGQASKPRHAPYGREFYVRQLEHLRAHYGWERAIAVGHSMGGMVAISWAAMHPAVVASVVAISPGGFGPEFSSSPRQRRVMAVLGRPGFTRLLYAVTSRLPYRLVLSRSAYADHDSVDPYTRRALRAALRAPGAEWSYSAPVRTPDAFTVVARQGDIHCPMHLIWGQQDALLPVANADAFAAVFPRSSLIFLPGGHCIQEERSREVAAEVRTLLTLDHLLAPAPAALIQAG